jgi:hypothetical protein
MAQSRDPVSMESQIFAVLVVKLAVGSPWALRVVDML